MADLVRAAHVSKRTVFPAGRSCGWRAWHQRLISSIRGQDVCPDLSTSFAELSSRISEKHGYLADRRRKTLAKHALLRLDSFAQRVAIRGEGYTDGYSRDSRKGIRLVA